MNRKNQDFKMIALQQFLSNKINLSFSFSQDWIKTDSFVLPKCFPNEKINYEKNISKKNSHYYNFITAFFTGRNGLCQQ